MQHTSLATIINSIGTQMVSCAQGCEGASSSAHGTPPRCLYLEEVPGAETGVIVVGLNPGKASSAELQFYGVHGLTYSATRDYLKQSMDSIKYYARVKALLQRIGLSGSVLWTEIAKCELRSSFGEVTLDMQRNCTRMYLSHELKACPGWPVVATGKTAFEAAALLASDRAVLGVPHPTGSWGKSFDTTTGNTTAGLTEKQRASIASALNTKRALWLGSAEA